MSNDKDTYPLGQIPTAQFSRGWRRQLKSTLGSIALTLRPERARQLAKGENALSLSLVDRMMVTALVARHERAGTLGELNGLHRSYWSDDGAVTYHTWAERFFQTWWLERADSILPPMTKAISESGIKVAALCEIGCGSGLVIDDLSRRFPEVPRFVGLDLSAAQMERNRGRFTKKRLSFEAGDVTTWVPEHAGPGWLYFTNNGVLEYLSETQLDTLFGDIARRFGPALFTLTEPLPKDYDLERETRSRPYNFEKSLGHNYVHWLKKNGWRLHFVQDKVWNGDRFLTVVASVGAA